MGPTKKIRSMKNIEFQNPSIHLLFVCWVILHGFRSSADFFSKTNFRITISVKEFGSRSGPRLCQA